jgi:O-antigen/teichoic acid export membrane protein
MYIKNKLLMVWEHFLNDHLFRNSIFLMLTTAAMGGFGFIFWTISTHLFNPVQIGLGTTIISSMWLISNLSLLGFNNTFIRYIPTSKDRNSDINSSAAIVILASILFSIVYILLIPKLSPDLITIRSSAVYSVLFILMVTMTSINSLTDSLFVAFRSTQYNFITDGIVMSLSKVLLPFVFVAFGAYGVFLSSGLSTLIGVLASVLILVYLFQYKITWSFNTEKIKRMISYSFTNYISSVFSMAPVLILPTIIMNGLGSAEAGYFFLSMMLINLLYSVSYSISQSLFAEGSHEDSSLLSLLINSTKIMILILIPASLIMAFFGPYILQLFGKSYSQGAGDLIFILSLSSPIIAGYNICNTILRIRHQMYTSMFINIIYAVTIYILSVLWVKNGLNWIGYAWILGNLISTVIAIFFIYYYRHLPTTTLKEV